MKLIPRGWREFQHYKDRNPPWIRLHRKLIDNKEYQRLPVASRALAPMLWLLASESLDGAIDGDIDDIAFRLRQTHKEIDSGLAPLIKAGFFVPVQPASTTLADCQQVAVPETETETETETSSEAEAEALQSQSQNNSSAEVASATVVALPKPKREPAVSAGAWDAYALAYERRYAAPPVRNAKVNAQLAQLVARIGPDEAPPVAAHYVGSQNRLYVQAGHCVDLLLRDAEKLRTEWATGRTGLAKQAVEADRIAAEGQKWSGVLQTLQAEQVQ